MARVVDEGKSKLLQWMLAFFFVFQVITLIQGTINLAATYAAVEFLASQTPVAIGINCMMVLAWVSPILAILLLAMKRSRRYAQGVAWCAIAALSDFGLKMLLGIGWMIVLLPAIMKSAAVPGAAPNSAMMTHQVIADHLPLFYGMQILTLLITLTSSLIVVSQVRKMRGSHFQPPGTEEANSEEETDLGDPTGWDEPRRKPTHDRGA